MLMQTLASKAVGKGAYETGTPSLLSDNWTCAFCRCLD